MENSRIYEKKNSSVQLVYNGNGLYFSVLCDCFLKATAARITRAVSKPLATL